jgi:hypothetical protein
VAGNIASAAATGLIPAKAILAKMDIRRQDAAENEAAQ